MPHLRQFVPRDKVFPLLVHYCSLRLLKNYQFHTSFNQKNCFELFLSAYLSILKISKLESDVWIWRLQSASLGLWTDDCNQLVLQPNKFTPTINLLITRHTCNLVGCGACHSMTAGYPLFLSSKSLQCSKRHFKGIQNSTRKLLSTANLTLALFWFLHSHSVRQASSPEEN